MGGGKAVQKQLDTFFTQLDQGPPSPYAFLGNEPDMGVPWLYDWAGAPWKAQKIVNDVRTQIFTDDPKTSLGGNDDLGTTSAQGVFSMLGMFPEAAGSADMALNSPEFPLEIMHLGNGKSITVNAPGADSVKNFYVQNMKLNGSSWHSPYLPASAFTHGATLDVKMGSTPDKDWGAGQERRSALEHRRRAARHRLPVRPAGPGLSRRQRQGHGVRAGRRSEQHQKISVSAHRRRPA